MQTQIGLEFFPVENNESVTLVTFSGDLDATNVEDVVEKIFAKMNNGSCRLIADFTKLRYVNSTGLGILLHFSKSAKEKEGFFKICCINENVFEIIDIIGATTLLEIYDTVADATASITK